MISFVLGAGAPAPVCPPPLTFRNTFWVDAKLVDPVLADVHVQQVANPVLGLGAEPASESHGPTRVVTVSNMRTV